MSWREVYGTTVDGVPWLWQNMAAVTWIMGYVSERWYHSGHSHGRHRPARVRAKRVRGHGEVISVMYTLSRLGWFRCHILLYYSISKLNMDVWPSISVAFNLFCHNYFIVFNFDYLDILISHTSTWIWHVCQVNWLLGLPVSIIWKQKTIKAWGRSKHKHPNTITFLLLFFDLASSVLNCLRH